jgi:hypothetical protein
MFSTYSAFGWALSLGTPHFKAITLHQCIVSALSSLFAMDRGNKNFQKFPNFFVKNDKIVPGKQEALVPSNLIPANVSKHAPKPVKFSVQF